MTALDLLSTSTQPVLFESDALDIAPGGSHLVVSAIGSFSCCDVWFRSASTNYQLHIYARLADARVLIRTVSASDAVLGTDSGDSMGVAASIRGLPATAFEIEVSTVEVPISGGNVYIQAWDGPAQPIAISGLGPADQTSSAAISRRAAVATDSFGTARLVKSDSSGRLEVGGGNTPAGGASTPTDAINAAAHQMMWDGSGWQFAAGDSSGRAIVKGDGAPVTNVGTPATALFTNSFPMRFDGTNWHYSLGDTSGRTIVKGDGVPGTNVGTPGSALVTNSFPMRFDGTNWRYSLGDSSGRDVVVGSTAPTTGSGTPSNTLQVNSFPMLWDGSAWRFASGDSGGHFQVTGRTTPAVDFATPTDAVSAAAFAMLCDTKGSGKWEPGLGDSSGRQIVTGDNTPTSGTLVGEVTNTVAVNAFPMVTDTGKWYAQRGDNAGRLYVSGDTATVDGGVTYGSGLKGAPAVAFLQLKNDATAGNISAKANPKGNLFVVPGIPDVANASQEVSTAHVVSGGAGGGAALVKAGASAVLSITAGISAFASGGAYLCLVNKSTAPAAGDSIIWSRWVATGTSFSLELLRHIRLSSGIGVAWSSGTTLAIANPTATISILYV